mmetsp:Transcript_17331/g.40387  ORF Transcript_17331/g.40387 Transcript_17331/m.40387 type:complete len:1088 (-) Transcript_17331:190-3453(-)
MAIQWLPKEIGWRFLKPHEDGNIRATYLLTTAYGAGFLAREDDKRPPWFPHINQPPVRALTPDMQEHLSNVCRVICLKVRQDVTAELGGQSSANNADGNKPTSNWQAGLLCARVLWRTTFAASAAKGSVNQQAVPVLFMCACDCLLQACRKLLTEIWNESQLQFTARVNKYRTMRSRPAWSVLEEIEYRCMGANGLGINNPAASSVPPVAGTRPAASLQDFMEEVIALRFAVDWLTASMNDAQGFIEQATKRHLSRSNLPSKHRGDRVEQQLAALKEKSVDSFAMMWTDDAELRSVSSLAHRLMDGLEGPSAVQLASTVVSHLMVAVWKGLHPMLEQLAKVAISRVAESQAVAGSMPPPALPEHDEDSSNSAVFDRVASSYLPAHPDCVELCGALPRGVLGAIVKVQACFRGYLFRARHFKRARVLASYCKPEVANWPLKEPKKPWELAEEEEEAKKTKDRKRKVQKPKHIDPSALKEEIQDFQPSVSKYLGGDATTSKKFDNKGSTLSPSPKAGSRGGFSRGTLGGSGLGSTYSSTMLPQDLSAPPPVPIRVTADHRACADLFMLYAYNMYRRRELVRMWQTLCGAYERSMDIFAELLERNPALRPMLESIAAQLKRGSVVGYDKAFIAKQQKQEQPSAQRTKPADGDLFRRSSPTNMRGTTSDRGFPAGFSTATSFPPKSPPDGSMTEVPLPQPTAMLQTGGMQSSNNGTPEIAISGEYLTEYLREMDGDDSQFKDIHASVVPLSTGTSPARSPPHESLLKQDQATKSTTPETAALGLDDATQAKGSSAKPKLDVPFCMEKLKPIWLPIKAHRFAAYRAKVLQLLPQRVLQQYVDFEKQAQYAACIKLLESATPGSLNVLSPAKIVDNKPLLVETVLQLIVGYSGLCLRNQQGSVAVKLITQVLDCMSLALRDLHPGHRLVIEAYLFDTALSVCYYMPNDIALSDRAESFFQQASERYLKLGHVHRYCKCCLRAAAVLHNQNRRSEAEYYTQQALNKLANAPVSSLIAVTYHNLAVHTAVQNRVPDAVAHTRAYVAMLRQLPKLSNTWMQHLDNTQWLILKIQELWAQHQANIGMRDSHMVSTAM